jgi:EthD domain
MKFFTFIRAAAGQDRRQFQQWFLKEHAPMVLEHVKGAQRYIVNLADVTLPPVENMTGLAPENAPAYEVITELWLGSARDFKDPARLYGSAAAADAVQQHLASRARAAYSYRVTEIVEKDLQPIRAGSAAADSKA